MVQARTDRAAVTPQLGLRGRLGWRARLSRRIELWLYLEGEAALTRTTVLVDSHSVWKSTGCLADRLLR